MAKQKKSRKKLYIFGGIGLLLVVLVIVAFFGSSKEEVIAVTTEDVQVRNITQTVTATGKINSEEQVIITPEVTGEIISLPVKEGDKVTKGSLLLKIKGDVYAAQRDRASASVQSSRASLNMNKAELDKITASYNRTKELHNKKLASDVELETAKSAYLTAQAQYESARANVSQSEASLKEINEQIYKTTIYSPMEGTVSGLSVELGERVLGSGFSQGTTLMTIADLSNMEATVEVDENDIPLVSIGDTAKVTVDAFGNKEFIGVVTEIGNAAKEAGLGTQEQVVNFNVKIKILNTEKGLLPGMSCTAEIQTETKSNVLSVPIQSVTARAPEMMQAGEEEEGGRGKSKDVKDEKLLEAKDEVNEIVFVVKNGKAYTKSVKTGLSDDNYIEILSGLNKGEKVVSGSYIAISRDLKNGAIVRTEDKNKKNKA